MKMTLTNLKKINTLAELQSLQIGAVSYDIGGRGGTLGFRSAAVAERVKVPVQYMPSMFGAYCNYLGGGIRGAMQHTDFDKLIVGRKRLLLEALGEACIRVYLNLEAEDGLIEENDDDGEINWDNVATNVARANGTKSAY